MDADELGQRYVLHFLMTKAASTPNSPSGTPTAGIALSGQAGHMNPGRRACNPTMFCLPPALPGGREGQVATAAMEWNQRGNGIPGQLRYPDLPSE